MVAGIHVVGTENHREFEGEEGADTVEVRLIVEQFSFHQFACRGVLEILELSPHNSVSNCNLK